MSSPSAPEPVLLYDGECGLCTALAGWALRHDRSGRLYVAPLQGATAQALLRTLGLPTEDFDTLVFVTDRERPLEGGYQLRSDGALAVIGTVGGIWRIFTWLRVIPQSWRDWGYGCVARVRKRIFGGARPLRIGDTVMRRVLP